MRGRQGVYDEILDSSDAILHQTVDFGGQGLYGTDDDRHKVGIVDRQICAGALAGAVDKFREDFLHILGQEAHILASRGLA